MYIKIDVVVVVIFKLVYLYINEMIKLKDILSERKQVGVIYHYTTLGGLQGILETNKLIAQRNFISFTRNKNYYPWKTSVKLSFDGTKLSDKYKIQPFSDVGNITANTDEQEEIIKLRKIDNISKYLLSVEINTLKFSTLDEKLWNDSYLDYIKQTMHSSFNSSIISIKST
jgi:hypothetical protein